MTVLIDQLEQPELEQLELEHEEWELEQEECDELEHEECELWWWLSFLLEQSFELSFNAKKVFVAKNVELICPSSDFLLEDERLAELG